MKSDYIENSSSRKVQYYHFNKQKRQDKTTKKAKLVTIKFISDSQQMVERDICRCKGYKTSINQIKIIKQRRGIILIIGYVTL